MGRLADDWQEQRQTCIDVLCAYLRMPAAPEEPGGASRGESEVRSTVLRLIADHAREGALRPGYSRWSDLDFDFTGARLGPVYFHKSRFSGRVRFMGTVFEGVAQFWQARFSGAVYFDDAVFEDYAWFRDVRFEQDVTFRSVIFRCDSSFRAAVFRSQAVFDRARFEAGARLTGARFENVASFAGTDLGPSWHDDGMVFAVAPTGEGSTLHA